MNITDIFSRMNSGELKAHSELGTRDERKQVRSFGARFQKLKLTTDIYGRMLAMKDLSLDFNPFTMKEDEVYNHKTPFRPILLVSQTIALIKKACAENPELNKAWAEYLGREFDPGEEATMEDYCAFRARGHIMPRVTTYLTVNLSFGGICGFPQFATKYLVDVTKLNEDNRYDMENAPLHHLGAVFFGGLIQPEVDKVRSRMEKENATKEAISMATRQLYAKSPVGFVGPTNLLPVLYFPMNAAPPRLDPSNPQCLEQHIRYLSYTDKFVGPMGEMEKNPLFDSDIDFYDFTINTPSSKEQKPGGGVYTDNDSIDLYKAMSVRVTDSMLSFNSGKTVVDGMPKQNSELFESVIETAKAYFLESQAQSGIEDGDTFEKIMSKSTRFRTIESVMPKFLEACNEVFNAQFANSIYLTEDYKKANSEFFTAMNPANALALADSDDDDLEAAKQGARQAVSALIADASPDGVDALDLEIPEDADADE